MTSPALTALDEGLQTFRNGLSFTPEWAAASPMTAALALIRARHSGEERHVERERVAEIVAEYLLTGVVFRQEDVFTLCIGAGGLDADGKGILGDRELRERLFTLAETVRGRARRLRAFRNLLHAYWTFPLHDDATPQAAIDGWKFLRGWLKERYATFNRHPARKPTWFTALGPHLHLLEENPCAPYATALLHGDFDELQRAIDCLLIPTGSWLKTEAVMARINAVVDLADAEFLAVLPDLLKLAMGEAGVEVPESVAQRAVARLVVRYAGLQHYEPHPALFRLAVARLGSPWRGRAAWDALVCDGDGGPSSLAREMVGDWLKDRLIGEFFGDAGQPRSRAELWQKYAVFIQELALAAPWPDAQGQALLLRMADFLVVVPKYRDQPIEAHSWQVFYAAGGTRLLDQDDVDGASIRAILTHRTPAARARQSIEEALNFLEFVISTKARLQSILRR